MRRALVLVLVAVLAACSSGDDGGAGAGDAATTSVRPAGEAGLVGVEVPDDCHVMQGGWVLCGSTQDHEGIDRTRGGLCTEGRRDEQLRLVPEVVVSPTGACPSYVEVPPGVTIVFVNEGEVPATFTIDDVATSPEVEPGGDWVVAIDESGQYPWHSSLNPALTGLLEVKPLDEAPPVSTVPPPEA